MVLHMPKRITKNNPKLPHTPTHNRRIITITKKKKKKKKESKTEDKKVGSLSLVTYKCERLPRNTHYSPFTDIYRMLDGWYAFNTLSTSARERQKITTTPGHFRCCLLGLWHQERRGINVTTQTSCIIIARNTTDT